MPCGYHVNHDDGLITINSDEASTLGQILAVAEQLLADPQFDPRLPQLVDVRGLEVTRDKTASRAIREFVLGTYRTSVQSSIAIVINESLDERTLADLYHMSCGMEDTEIFDQYDQALKWHSLAAEQGHGGSQCNLAVMYANGWGVPQDDAEALKWYNLAAASMPAGEPRDLAIKSRDILERKMTPAQVAEAQRLAREWKPK